MRILIFYIFLLILFLSEGSHFLLFFGTYIKGNTPFPEFSYVMMLDDVRVLYYNGETKTIISRGNTTPENNVFDLNGFITISGYVKDSFIGRLAVASQNLNNSDGVLTFQRLVACELRDDGEPGRMITRDAFRRSTTDELLYVDGNFSYQGTLNVSAELLDKHLEFSKWRHETLYQPFCIKTLKAFLQKRRNQVKRKVKPRVRLIEKANSDSGGFAVTCLATGFYPRHLNLSLFRDGQPVSGHEVTGGDLLPNGDGTYQMRKSLEIRGDERHKHTYSCSATHLSLDNSMTVDLEFDHSEPFKSSVIPVVLTCLVLVLVFGIAVIIWRKWQRD